MPQESRGIPWPIWALVTILTAVIGAYSAYKIAESSHRNDGVTHTPDTRGQGRQTNPMIPDLTGVSNTDAYNRLRAAGFSVRQVDEQSATIGPCKVIRTVPAANSSAPAGSMVDIYVSFGPPSTAVHYGCPPLH